MRLIAGTSALLAFLVAGASCAIVRDEKKPPPEEFRLALTAPVDEVRAAVAERAVFDGTEVVFPPEVQAVVLRRSGSPFDERDWLVSQLRDLDRVLAARAKLRALSDEELGALFDAKCRVPPQAGFGLLRERDPALLEIVRRGGDAWRDRVRTKLDLLQAWKDGAAKDGGTRSWDARDLELLTALRRLEGKPDPVRVEVTVPEPTPYPDLPTVELEVVNHDERTVTMTLGGDYRSGRESRYHVEVRDAKGRLLPSVQWNDDLGLGGGMYQRQPIAKDEGLSSSLPLSSYVAPLDPGTYQARVHYSDWSEIAGPDRLLGRVTVVSEPFTVKVEPRVVETTRDEQAKLAALAEELPTKGPVVVLDGSYGPWAHEFVPPGTAAGKLLAAGWSAVPPLARFVGRGDADPLRRAWAFAVLHAITGRLSPAATDAIGDLETHSERFRGFTGGGFRPVASGWKTTIDPDAQDELARSWMHVASLVELREPK